MKHPLLIIAFNRPEILFQLLSSLSIEQLKNRRIYFAVDGPRNKTEELKVQKVETVIKKFAHSNDLNATYFFSKTNKGCKISVSEAITKVLNSNDAAIILEDDCIPSVSFLPYCDELLDKHKNDSHIMMINGTTFVEGQCGSSTHRLSKCAIVWGWATWARAWNNYDVKMSDYQIISDTIKQRILAYFGKYGVNINKLISSVQNDRVDTWDAQWVYSLWRQSNFHTILPNVNLISNIGFGLQSTHTKIKSRLENRELKSISFPLGKLHQAHDTQSLDVAQLSAMRQLHSFSSIIDYWISLLFKRT